MNMKNINMSTGIGCLLIVFIASAVMMVAAIKNNKSPTIVEIGVNDEITLKKDCTDLARDEETLMVFSTLGGGLTAIDPTTSEIRWTIADDPPIVAEQQQNVQVPQYLPDPRDGSIYQLGNMGSLKKLPYTIPQLVANAPCRSSDGILYSGKKSDTWFIVDPKTGQRQKVMGFGGPADNTNKQNSDKIGWATSRSIYLGRTQYTVMMFDSLTKDKNVKPWNITFYDYNALTVTPDITKDYEYLHLTTTSNGNILTVDRNTGKFLWQKDLTSPVVAAFLLSSEGLLSVPFTTVSDEAFNAILEESQGGNINAVKLFQSLYIGEHRHGLYALPSLVDKNTPRISPVPPIKLIDGPNGQQNKVEDTSNTVYINNVFEENAGIVLGHYNVPNDINLQISPAPSKVEFNRDLATINKYVSNPFTRSNDGYGILSRADDQNTADVSVQTEANVLEYQIETNAFNKTKKIILLNTGRVQQFLNKWFMEHPSGKVHQILIILVLAMVGMFWYMYSTMRELKNQSENGSKTYGNGSGGKGSGSNNVNTEELLDLGNGYVRVGKISFNCNDVLGKGCEGTFVFKGTFEERSVAVKRLLPECFTFADREVALLRESDAHENVVRYFCTEQDRQFRYIAVELCAATLQDYTEGDFKKELRDNIDVWEIMRQAAAGLSHLHSLNIVHRDIKPQNVLLSLPDVNGNVRVMISDFGLCKKLNFGKMSFSRRSGITGTDGWIAPEMMYAQRTTTSVDIFSLGCVYYYVLSGGHHAFGDALKRQANILSNEYNLSKLTITDSNEKYRIILAEQLIQDMISGDSQRRPFSRCIGNHPIFWSQQKILAFLQDVSDRVEKLQFISEPLSSLEKNGSMVVMDDWNLQLEPIITEDLRKHRGYMGASVRDLLRALRNKKHHYHELSDEVQNILGTIPNEFTNYWLSKFPHLISHAYHALSICSTEPLFKPYYSNYYDFSRPTYFDMEDCFPILLRQPKPLPKQLSESPKRFSRTPENLQYARNRKGAYNFRKSRTDEDANDLFIGGITNIGAGVGLQRNVEMTMTENVDNIDEKRDPFANFKFRRYKAKPKTRKNEKGDLVTSALGIEHNHT